MRSLVSFSLILASLASFAIFAEPKQPVTSAAKIKQSVAAKGRSLSTPVIKNASQGVKITRNSVTKKIRETPQLKAEASKQELQVRAAEPKQSASMHQFSFYDAWTVLEVDYDNDGYFSEFTLNFDADFTGGYADVYAVMYLSKDGGPWIHFNTTDVFTIYSNDSTDSYSVFTRLNSEFSTGNYDLLIDLYEVGVSGIAATAEPYDFNGLNNLPLEDRAHETNSDDTLITYVASELSVDLDQDGFYTELSLEYDIDTLNSGMTVYSEVTLTNVDTMQQVVVSTDDYFLGNQTEVNSLILEAGYAPGWYDIEVRIIDSYTGEVLAIAAQDFNALIQLTLESYEYDNAYDSPQPNNGHLDAVDVVVVHESGGGSLGILGALLLVLSAAARAYKGQQQSS
ncbi:choice-of-anchor H family protein [Aliikangiella sp. IMCC44653]